MRTTVELKQNLPVYIKVDKTIVGYVAAVTKQSPRDIMILIRDMSSVALERYLTTTKYKTWQKIQFPGTDLHFKIKCSREQNWELRNQHYREYLQKFEADSGLKRSKKRKEMQNYRKELDKWRSDNPYEYQTYDYTSLMIEACLYGKVSYIMMSQEEVEFAAIESLLLTPGEDEDE